MALDRLPDPPHSPPGAPAPGSANPAGAANSNAHRLAGFRAAGEGLADIDLREMARKIWRRKGTLVGVTVIGTIIAALILFQLTPKYTSTATVMIDPRESKVLDVQAVLSGMPADQETIESEIEVLLSRRLAERVIQKLALYRSPEFNARLRPVSGTQKMLRALNPKSLIPDSMLEWMNLASTGPGLTEEQILEKERIGIIDEHLDKLAVKRVGRSRVIAISVTLANPALAAAVANAVADL